VSVRALLRAGVIFDEGARPEIRLVAPDGSVLRPRRDHAEITVFAGLSRGAYRMRAALRPCDGSCGHLDPPTMACSAHLRVAHDRSYRVIWSGNRPCRIDRG